MFLTAAMALSLVACGGNNSTGSTGSTGGDTSVVADGTWPDKPITILCGYSAGGSSDLGCRYVAEALRKELGVPVVVENVPGSGSWLAWNQLLNNTEPDGYTMALVNLSAMYGHYDEANPRETTLDDFELLANHVIDYQVLAIRSDETRFTDYASLIEYAKENPLILASATAGITSGDATTMFLAGETDFLSANLGDVMDAEANGYKPIVIFAPERSPFAPDVPTSIELGLDDYVSFSARGYAYMPGVDQAIVDRMTEALIKVMDDEDYQNNMAAMGAQLELYTGDDYYNLLMDQLDTRLELWDVEK